MQLVQDTLAGLRIGEPIVHRQMAMFPLLGKGANTAPPAYLTLDEALAASAAQVSEVSQEGSVPELLFRNLGDRPVLLMEGEELVGAKQNRTLNVSILAPPQQEMLIPVSCVERGRWGYDGDDAAFQGSDRAHFARGRQTKLEAVNRRMSVNAASRDADQGAIWEEIDTKMVAMSAPSDTDAMGDIYEQHRGSLEDYVGGFAQQPGQVGAVFMVGARFAGVDLFAHDATCAALLPKLLRSYALDALELGSEKAIEPPADFARLLLADLVAAPAREYPAVGQGRDVRIESPAIAGGALLADGVMLHLAAFRRDAGAGPVESAGYRRASQRRASRLRRR